MKNVHRGHWKHLLFVNLMKYIYRLQISVANFNIFAARITVAGNISFLDTGSVKSQFSGAMGGMEVEGNVADFMRTKVKII